MDERTTFLRTDDGFLIAGEAFPYSKGADYVRDLLMRAGKELHVSELCCLGVFEPQQVAPEESLSSDQPLRERY